MKTILSALLFTSLFVTTSVNSQTLLGKWRIEKFSGDTTIIGNIIRSATTKTGVDYKVLYSCKTLFNSNFRALQRSLTDKTGTFTMNFISKEEFTLPHEETDKDGTNIDTYKYSTLDGVIHIGNGYHQYQAGGKWNTREYYHNDLVNYKLTGSKLVFTLQCGEVQLNLHFKKLTK